MEEKNIPKNNEVSHYMTRGKTIPGYKQISCESYRDVKWRQNNRSQTPVAFSGVY